MAVISVIVVFLREENFCSAMSATLSLRPEIRPPPPRLADYRVGRRSDNQRFTLLKVSDHVSLAVCTVVIPEDPRMLCIELWSRFLDLPMRERSSHTNPVMIARMREDFKAWYFVAGEVWGFDNIVINDIFNKFFEWCSRAHVRWMVELTLHSVRDLFLERFVELHVPMFPNCVLPPVHHWRVDGLAVDAME